MSAAVGFRTVVGHAKAIAQLREAVSANRLAHAWLFTGSEGIGKRTLARAVAAYLLCRNRGEDACGSCVSCKKLADGNHPDFTELQREKQVYVVDQVREVSRRCSFSPSESSHQVFIIPEANRLYHTAANALLKTLEEPTGSAIFILTTHAPNQMLPTVLSRCRRLTLSPPDLELAADYVAQKLSVDRDKAALLLRLYDDSPGRALEADESLHGKLRSDLAHLLSNLKDEPQDIVRLAALLETESANLDQALGLFRSLLYDAALIGMGADPSRLTHTDLAGELRGFADRHAPDRILDKVRNVDMARLYLERNANPTGLCLAAASAVAMSGRAKQRWRIVR